MFLVGECLLLVMIATQLSCLMAAGIMVAHGVHKVIQMPKYKYSGYYLETVILLMTSIAWQA